MLLGCFFLFILFIYFFAVKYVSCRLKISIDVLINPDQKESMSSEHMKLLRRPLPPIKTAHYSSAPAHTTAGDDSYTRHHVTFFFFFY